MDLNRIQSILNGNDQISLRIIDFILYKYINNDFTVFQNLKLSYLNRLKILKKSGFSIFRTGKEKIIYTDNNISFETTHGQLNFFKWLFESGLINYIDNNIDHIKLQLF
jgi:hypothetical protein